MSNRHDDLHNMLRRLNLSHKSTNFTETALQAAKANLSHEVFLKGYTQLQQLDKSV